MFHEFFGQLFGGVEQESSGDAAVVFNRFEQLQFVLLAHARQLADLAFARQLLHALQVAHLMGAPDQGNRLRPQTLNLEEFKHRGAVFFQQLGVRFDAAIFEKHLQIGQHAFANARHRKKFFRLLDQVGHLLRQCFNGLRRIAIGTHAKRVLPVDLEEIGSLVEKSGDGFVVHSELYSESTRIVDPETLRAQGVLTANVPSNPRCPPAVLYTSSIRRSRPIARAARHNVCSVTEAFPGSSRRSRAARLVFMRRAISTLLIFALFIAFCTCHARASLSAVARASSRIPSSFKKSSSDDPIRGFFFFISSPPSFVASRARYPPSASCASF